MNELESPIFLLKLGKPYNERYDFYRFFNGVLEEVAHDEVLDNSKRIRGWLLLIRTSWIAMKKEEILLYLGDDEFFYLHYLGIRYKLYENGFVIWDNYFYYGLRVYDENNNNALDIVFYAFCIFDLVLPFTWTNASTLFSSLESIRDRYNYEVQGTKDWGDWYLESHINKMNKNN